MREDICSMYRRYTNPGEILPGYPGDSIQVIEIKNKLLFQPFQDAF